MADLVEIGASFDWISPLWAFANDIANGGGHHFAVATDYGYSGNDIKRMLKKAGVKSWGWMVVSNTIIFSTRKEHAAKAQGILEANGITTVSAAPKTYKQSSRVGQSQAENDNNTKDQIADSLTKMRERRGNWIQY